jgi:hypothetical protein
VLVVLVDFVPDFDREVDVAEDARDEGQGARVADRDRKKVACLQRGVEDNESHRSHKAVMCFHTGLSAPCERGDQTVLIDLMAEVWDRDEDNVDVQLSHSETHYRMDLTMNSGRMHRQLRRLQVASLSYRDDDDCNRLQGLQPILRCQEIRATDGGASSFE